MSKTCLLCGNGFEGTGKQKFCSDKHRYQYFKANKNNKRLAGPEPTTTAPTSQQHTVMEAKDLPGKMDVLTSFILSEKNNQLSQKEKTIEKLEAQIKERDDKIEALNDQIDIAQKAIDAKPTGLGALAALSEKNPALLEKAMELSLPLLGALANKFLSDDGDQMKGVKEHPVCIWILQQPESIQRQFIDMVNALSAEPEKASERIAEFTRTLMNTSAPKQEVKRPTATLGFGR